MCRMERIADTSTICGCNRLFAEETLHPLVSVIDAGGRAEKFVCDNCYSAVLSPLTDAGCASGHTTCDFSHATITFRRPGKTVSIPCATDAVVVVFHPDIIRCTPLGQAIGEYTFFDYADNEALFMSLREAQTAKRCFEGIKNELRHGIDKYSKRLICNHIELLLNYSKRFYTRQFITRRDSNIELIARIDTAIRRYFEAGRAAGGIMPAAQYIARELGVSAAYLDDTLHHETGKHTADYVSLWRIKTAKVMLMNKNLSAAGISASLGFCSEACFRTIFKKITGCEPDEYRKCE